MTVTEAAKLMGVSVQFLRMALRQDKFDFGTAIKSSENRYVYYINDAKLKAYLEGK